MHEDQWKAGKGNENPNFVDVGSKKTVIVHIEKNLSSEKKVIIIAKNKLDSSNFDILINLDCHSGTIGYFLQNKNPEIMRARKQKIKKFIIH